MGKIKFPLDPEATEAVDDRFYEMYPSMAPDGNRIPLSVDSPTEDEMRKEWRKMYLEELAKKRAEDDDPDDDDPINPVIPCGPDKPCFDCSPIKSVDVSSLTFLDDHGLMLDNDSDWTHTGQPFDPPDWTAQGVSHPISVTMDKLLNVKIKYTVGDPDACPESGTVRGLVSSEDLSGNVIIEEAFGPDPASFEPSAVPVVHPPTSIFKPSRAIRREMQEIGWEAEADYGHDLGTTRNEMFVIFGPSKIKKAGSHAEKFKHESWREDGATVKRMRTAVEWASGAQSINELKILEHLFGRFDSYVLGRGSLDEADNAYLDTHPELWKKLKENDWPSFRTPLHQDVTAGAWPIAENTYWSGDCQAICRFILGIMRQIGHKDTIEFRQYTADFSEPHEILWGFDSTGPRVGFGYALVDGPVVRSKTYWKGESDVGFNASEAFLKYTPVEGGDTRLFGGGMTGGPLPTGSHPLHEVFWGMVEYKGRRRRDGTYGRRITRYRKYRGSPRQMKKWSGNIP